MATRMLLGGFLVFIFLSTSLPLNEKREFFFTQVSICTPLTTLVSQGCIRSQETARNDMECTDRCLSDDECVGSVVIHNRTSPCVLLQLCNMSLFNKTCQGVDSQNQSQSELMAVLKACYNGGRFRDDSQRICKCTGGWVGRHCQTRGRDCRQLKEGGYYGTNWVELDVDGEIKLMRCRIYGSANFLMFRSSGEFGLKFTWQEYKNGFYLDKKNYFVGLKIMHKFLAKKFNNQLELAFRLKLPSGSSYGCATLHFNCTISDEASGYTLLYDGLYQHYNTLSSLGPRYQPPAAHCLERNLGAPFSTWDHDQDGDPGANCAQIWQSGWWFKGCNLTCHPFGLNFENRSPNDLTSGLLWPGLNLSDPFFTNFTFKIFAWLRYL